MFEPTSNVVSFKSRKAAVPQRPPKSLLEAVYSAGSLAVAPDDQATKMAAALLGALGFFVIEEVQPDGTARPIGRGEARFASPSHPWRLLKPAVGGTAGVPDAAGGSLGP